MSALLRSLMLQLGSASRLAGTPLLAQSRPSAPRCVATAVRATGEKEKAPTAGKRDLVNAVKAKTGLTQDQAAAAVEAALDTIVDSVAKGQRVTIPGFGTFEARQRAARKGRNPKTGEDLFIDATTAPAFSAGKGFKETVKAAFK